mmetsp:Transcript_748/g.2810  ORF Transcript_748/g.2810 Transcript_748/m.2810 type:complete len:122 (+) Transcript_748:68-433(+)
MAFAVSASRAVVAAPAAAPQRSTARATTAAPKKALRLNSFTGMKATNAMPGVEASVEQKWAAAARKQTRGSSATAASALQTKASVAGEIFSVAPVVFGATMIGLAIGFVLLRVEAVVEGEE